MGTRLLRRLLSALARFAGRSARAPQLLPAELVLEVEVEDEAAPAPVRLQPPPIPAEARLPLVATGRPPSAQERAWQELMNGRHPRLIIRSLARVAPSRADSRPV